MKPILTRIALIAFIAILIIPSPTPAATKTFIKEYTYQASDFDSKMSSRTIALEQVKRLLLEEVGTYLTSETDVKDFQLTKDKITTLSAGVIQTEILTEKWDGKTYYLKARVSIDPQEVARLIEGLKSDREKSKQLEETNRKVDEALRRIKELQDELAKGRPTEKKQNEYSKAVAELKAKEWMDKGIALMNAEKYESALSAFNSAVEMNPASAVAYQYKGWALNSLADYDQALIMFNRAADLDPQNPWTYINRAGSLIMLGNCRQALPDAEKGIGLDPTIAHAYAIRGWAYLCLGNYDLALADFNKSLQMSPNNPLVYVLRAWANNALGNKRQTADDFDQSFKLAPNNSIVLWNIAAFHALSGEKEKSLSELSKALSINAALKKLTKTNPSFQSLRSDPTFIKLIQ